MTMKTAMAMTILPMKVMESSVARFPCSYNNTELWQK
jgi:hypothetical protein